MTRAASSHAAARRKIRSEVHPAPRSSHGFTLAEMIVALSVFGIRASVSPRNQSQEAGG